MTNVSRFVSSAAFGLAALSLSSLASADGALRTVLVIDASSSMRATDPRELRKVAAELFVDLTRDGDELAVVGFDGAARDAMPALVKVKGSAERELVKRAVRAVGNDGAWTDFTAGLEGARQVLAKSPRGPGDQDLIVFLTDGRCDPDPKGPLGDVTRTMAGKARAEDVCQSRVLGEIVPALGKARIYAVGLSKSAPKIFLENLGRTTGGTGLATDRADELPRLFADIFSRLFGSRLIEGNASASLAIPIDEGVSSVDFVVVGPQKLGASLFDPAGAELPKDNARPSDVEFTDGPAYRLFRVEKPAPGAYRLDVAEGGKGGRYAVLQNFNLKLDLPSLPEVIETGKPRSVTLRLATPGGKVPPKAFLDRHAFSLSKVEGARSCEPSALESPTEVPLKQRPDGTFEATITPSKKGALCLIGRMTPGESGVLTREVFSSPVRVIPPIHLKASVAQPFGAVKQDGFATALISLDESEVGELVFAEIGVEGLGEGMSFSHKNLEIGPAGPKSFSVELRAGHDSPPGPREIVLRILPKKPAGFEDRAVEVRLPVKVVPLTFWERHGRTIKLALIALFFLVFMLGLMLPSRFRRTSMLHYEDRRDPDLPREGKFPLGVKARAGFYKSARVAIGAMGPVRRGGDIELVAGPGGSVLGRPLAGKRARELPRDTSDPTAEPREVKLVKGVFRVSPGVKYEIEGTGLVFSWSPR